ETKDVVKKFESQLGLTMKDLESITLVLMEPVLDGPGFPQGEMKMKGLPAVERWEKKPTAPIKLPEDKKPEKPKFEPGEKKDAVPPSPVSFQQDEQFVGMEMEHHHGPMGPVVFIVTAHKALDRKKMLQRL